MSGSRSILLIVVSALILTSGCDEPFSAKGGFREELVAYAILSNTSDTLFARLYKTYDPPAFDPFEHRSDNPLVGAQLIVSDGINQWTLNDTVITRSDTSRYTDPLNAYVVSPLKVDRGKIYALSIQPPSGSQIVSAVSIPDVAYISIYRNQGGVSQPRGSTDRAIGVRVNMPSKSKGYLIRFFVTYDALQNSVWTPHEMEIPYSINDFDLPEEHQLFPELQRSSQTEGVAGSFVIHLMDFVIGSYIHKLDRVYKTYGSGAVRFKKAIFTLTQVEQNLYNYYNVSHGFRDPNSIRVDEPDVTSISGAVGVFGAFTVDSVSIALPATP